MSRQTLGIIGICLNEERDMPGFIEHLMGWVDEIIIIDDGSTDATAQIAARYGSKVKFIVSPRGADGSWAGQRNKGIAAAESDWLLHMDIDERVSPQLAEEIRRAIENPDFDAYRYRRLNFLLHRPMRGGGWERWNNVQLARRPMLTFTGPVHERAGLSCPPERIGQLTEKMWHLNDESWEERMRKSLNYSRVEGTKLAQSSKPIRWYHFFTRPFWMSFKTYVFLHGYRDGIMGIILALHNFSAGFAWQAIAWDKRNQISRESLEKQIQDGYVNFRKDETGK